MSRGWNIQGQVRTVVLYHPMVEDGRTGERREERGEKREGELEERSEVEREKSLHTLP